LLLFHLQILQATVAASVALISLQRYNRLLQTSDSTDKRTFISTSNKYRLQHCLEWVMRVYTSKLTPDSVATYLFHDCERSLWLFCLVWLVRAMIKVQYTSTDRPVLRVCAMFERLTELCFVFWFGFRASLLDFTSRIERLHVCYYCADVLSVLAIFVANTVAHIHRQAGQVRSSTACVCRSFHDARGRSAVRAQPWLLQRLLGGLSHAVHWCVTHYRQTVCREISPVITL